MKHYHDQQFEQIMDFVYPMPSMPGVSGGKNPLDKVNDATAKMLKEMSLGSIVQLKMANAYTSEPNVVEIELLEITKTGEPVIELTKAGQAAEVPTFIKTLEKQEAQGMTARRKVIKEGDGVTSVKKGDIVTVRQIVSPAKNLWTNTTTTYVFPQLAEPFTMKYKFDPIKVKMGMYVGPKYKFPSFTMELVNVQKAN